MKEKIKSACDHPELLERLYRKNKRSFKLAFPLACEEIPENDLIKFWKLRLEYSEKSLLHEFKSRLDLKPLFISIIFAAFFLFLADIFRFSTISSAMYEHRNTGLIIFMGIALYSLLRQKGIPLVNWLAYLLIYVILALQLNTLPQLENGQVLNLVIIHTYVVCWFVYGLILNNNKKSTRSYWTSFLRFNGDLFVFSGLILICWWIILTVTYFLFESLQISINETSVTRFMILSVAVSPLIASFALERLPELGNRIVPLIARIFNPVVLVVIIIYMWAMIKSGANLFQQREFLLIFNIILFSVLAVILFSLSNISERGSDKYRFLILYLLTLFSCSLNLIAFSAIIYRLLVYGITPNRIAVTGINFIVFANLIKIGIDLLGVRAKKKNLEDVTEGIAAFLPVYGIWALLVVLVFPLIFF